MLHATLALSQFHLLKLYLIGTINLDLVIFKMATTSASSHNNTDIRKCHANDQTEFLIVVGIMGLNQETCSPLASIRKRCSHWT